jgi:superkiller protein 3
LLRAFLAQEREDYRAQKLEAEACRRLGLFDHRALLLLGDAELRQKDLEGARQTYEAYHEIQPALAAVQNNLGRVDADLGRFAEAEAAYRSGMESLPGNPVLVSNLAALYKRMGREDEALALFRTHGAGTARAQHNLGLMLAQQGDLDSAMTAYRRALQMDPDLEEVRYSLAGLQMLRGELAASAASFEAYLVADEVHPTYARRARQRLLQIYPVLGDRYLAEGDWARALHVFLRMEALGGVNATVYGNIAALYRRLGQSEKALAACDDAIRAFPDSAEAYFTRALLLDEAGDRHAAARDYGAFLERGPAHDRRYRHAAERLSALKR